VGTTHYELGRFEEAFAEYSAAYELYPVPAFLFNLGQCQRELGNFDRALFFYEGFLRAMPDSPQADLVAELMEESRQALARQEAERAMAARAAADQRAGGTAGAGAEGAAEGVAEGGSRLGSPFYKRWWFWAIVGGVVAASVGTAIGVVMAEPDTTLPAGSLGTIDNR
jgi:tetratricopeptide (TPR) repeat protein